MTAVLRAHARARAMSRSTLWRVLDEADLKPHRCVYWLNSHDPAFDAKARDICALYEHALRFTGVKAKPYGGGLAPTALTPAALRVKGYPCRMDRSDRL